MGVTDRSIVIRLKADVASALTGLKASSAAVKDFAGQTVAASAKHEKAWSQVGKASVIGGALLVGAFFESAKAAAEFDKAMSSVKANVDDKTAPSMARLSKAALLAGRTTAFSAKEAADAENELAKAGIGAADIVGGALHASLILASAGQIDLASSAAILSATMVQFGLHAKDAAHIADVLSAGADKSLGGVQDLGEALKYAGVSASQMGISLDQTVGVLAEFASRGIIGSMAGTGFRQMLVSLTAPTVGAANAMAHYGISVFDTQGHFIGLDKVAGVLHDRLNGLSQSQQAVALSTIFTNRSMAEGNILMKDGAAGVRSWTQRVNDAGFAARQAATKMDNLSGDLMKLKNSLNVGLIETGQQSTGVLRQMIQGLDGILQAYDKLQPAQKGFIVDLAGGVGGLALLGGTALLIIPKIAKLKAAITELQLSMAAVKTGGIIGGVIAALLIGKSAIDASVAGRVAGQTDALANSPTALAAARARQADLARQLAALTTQHATAGKGGAGGFAGGAAALQGQYNTLTKEINAASAGNDQFGKSLQQAQKDGDQLVPSILRIGDSYRVVQFDVSILTGGLESLMKAVLPLEASNDTLTKDAHALTDAVKAQAKQFHDTGHAIKGNSDEALNNRAALRGMTSDAIGVIDAYAKTGKSSDQVAAKTAAVKANFIKLAEKAGFTKGQIAEYIAQIDLVPSIIKSSLVLNGVDPAIRKLATLSGAVHDYTKALQIANGVGIGVYAQGKPLRNPGKGGSGPNGPPAANGAVDHPGGFSTIGERGQETMYVPPGARIWPWGQTPSFPGPQGGGGVQMTVQKVDLIRGGPQDVADALSFAMAARGR